MEISRLVLEVNETMKQLEDIWDDVGTPKRDREEEIRRLSEEIHEVLERKRVTESGIRDNLSKQLILDLQQIIEICSLLGESPMEDLKNDEGSLLERSSRVANNLLALQQRKYERTVHVQGLVRQIEELTDVLGVEDSCHAVRAEDLSDSHVGALVTLLENLKELKREREDTILALREELFDLSQELEEEVIWSRYAPLSAAHIDDLRRQQVTMTAIRDERVEKIQQLVHPITGLWDVLGISTREREEFFAAQTRLGLSVLIACQDELKRLERMKKERLGSLVKQHLAELRDLWQEAALGPHQQEQFEESLSALTAEEVLEALQDEADKMHGRISEVRPIQTMVDKREEILEEHRQFELTANDSSRLLSKKTGRDPGRLLREEKLRKVFTKQLPQLEAKLKTALLHWQTKYGQPFFFKGQNYLLVLEEDQENKLRAQEEDRLKKEKEKLNASLPLGAKRAGLMSPNATISGLKSPSVASTPQGSPTGKKLVRSALSPVNNRTFASTPIRKSHKTLDAENHSPYRRS
eukprot:TRINITY_DN10093_c0_g1_i2.p1 TRINITY_DN10093_c0_g1~~TRINITY_DN10093_c0_g1_i2.p1  ORF type:complete len:526 (+),score=124.87 TRINITY_DN10093_c0_g1_i2:825-2402(+)